jgi:hypothetical protein
MKKLPITKEAFEKSKYFTNKYGKLEYVSESGKLFKTDKGKIMKFKESITESGKDVESAKSDVWRSIIMQRYSQSKEDVEKWAEIFEERLEAYVQARIAEHDGKNM